MKSNDIGSTVINSFNNSFYALTVFIPKFIAGLIVLLIGIIIASIVKQLVLQLFYALKIDTLLKKYRVPQAKDVFSWTNLLAEIIRWFIILMFLIPTADIWGLPQVVTVLNSFLLYLPNVFVAAIIGLVGLVFARLASDVIKASTGSFSKETSATVASVARWAIIIFTLLAVLSQLGVATDLIRILFTGVVAMIAIAGGIAFGLGGQGAAKNFLETLQKRMKQ